MPKEYTSAALDMDPCCSNSGAMWVIVPVYSAFDPIFGECSGSRRLSPKSDTFAVNPRVSPCKAKVMSSTIMSILVARLAGSLCKESSLHQSPFKQMQIFLHCPDFWQQTIEQPLAMP